MTLSIDEQSLLADVAGTVTLAELEDALTARGLSIGFVVDAELAPLTVAEWIARGMPGAPSALADPADHVVAGLVGRIGARVLEIRPGPRRAVGPDLVCLFTGTRDRLGTVERAWIRAHRRAATRPELPLPAIDLDPPPSPEESRLVDAIARELGVGLDRAGRS